MTSRYIVGQKSNCLIIAAIEIGNSHGCYSFGWCGELRKDPNNIKIKNDWRGSNNTFYKGNVPLAVLFDEKKIFHSFGYDAEDKYAELSVNNEHFSWYFFREFKTFWQRKRITSDIEIDDTKGKTMKAVDVFGAIIGYLKQHLLGQLFRPLTGLTEEDVFWILTVPDSWSLGAHLLMEEAAYNAGINENSLSMITQSVAALTFCQRMHKSEMDGVCGADSTVGNQEDKFVVINAGHDDTHISVYKRNTDVGQLELLNATEGPWGGTFVDDQLYSMLSIIIGRSVHQMLVDFDRTDILDFQRKLKTKWMTTRTSHDQEKVRIVLYDCNFSSCIMKGILQATKPNKGTIFWGASKFGIKTETYETLFKPCIGEIVRHVKDILLQPNSVETNTYILVGELSESPIFQDAIKKALLNGKFIIPLNPSKAVCRGAVQFAHKPLSVTPTSPKHAESVKETLTHIFHCGINPFLFH